MKTIFLLVIAFVIVGVGAFILLPSLAPTSSPTLSPTPVSSMQPQTLPMSSRYVPYASGTLTQNTTGRRVLFFYANWCPTCRPADEDFQKNVGQIPADVVVIRVNYNDTQTDQEEKNLAAKYGVTYQHTFVQIDELGNEVTKWNGGQIEELLENLK